MHNPGIPLRHTKLQSAHQRRQYAFRKCGGYVCDFFWREGLVDDQKGKFCGLGFQEFGGIGEEGERVGWLGDWRLGLERGLEGGLEGGEEGAEVGEGGLEGVEVVLEGGGGHGAWEKDLTFENGCWKAIMD